MAKRLSTFILLIAAVASTGSADARKKADRKVAEQVKQDITFLSGDALEGRRTGTEGEHLAVQFIEARYKQLGISGYNGKYEYPFNFTYGRDVAPSTSIKINGNYLKFGEEAFPLPYSANKHLTSDVLPEVTEQGNIWLVSFYADKDQANDPHFDWEKQMYEAAKKAKKDGASGVVFYDAYNSKYAPTFNKHAENDALDIPVAFVTYAAWQKYIKPKSGASQSGGVPVDLDITIDKVERIGTNVATFIDNKAPYTVVIGAHLDHLGYGEDGNSLYANVAKEHLIHHGADDNASGTAALMELARWVKKTKLHNYNYLFVHFSGEELGLYGSKAFVKEQKIDSSKIAYMLNLDMVGRLNDSTHALNVGGVGTSPAWASVVGMAGDDFKVTIDSSGVGPSDHTSFYYAGIPVLFFFTGTHKDYHKPSDKADLINYAGEVKVLKYAEKVLTKMDKEHVKPVYTATKQTSTGGRSKYKVTLGVMPDYTYKEGGLRIDGVTDGKPAAKAGLKSGDIIVQIASEKVKSIQSYMEALGTLTPGDKINVVVNRDGKEVTIPVQLNK